MLRHMSAWSLVGLLLLGGCGAAESSKARYAANKAVSYQGLSESSRSSEAITADAAEPDIAQTAAEPAASAAARQMIYTANVELVVADFAALRGQIDKLIAEHQAVLADSSVDLRYGDHPSGTWTVRVPADQWEAFRDAVLLLGTAEKSTVQGEDVTEEFVDIQARLANRRRLEQRLLDLMENKIGDLKHILQVESELARVREGIEQIEGRLRYLKDRISLSTVTIHARQETDYTPPRRPTFAVEIQETFGESLRKLALAGKGLVLAAVFLAPWLPIPLLVMGVPWWMWRRRKRSA